jgi:hypothetical protein
MLQGRGRRRGRPGKGRTVDELSQELDRAAPLQPLLGYLNFAEGKPDVRFRKGLSDAYAFLHGRGVARPWAALSGALRARLAELHAAGAAAFRDTRQAEAALALTFDRVLPAYRAHHADLLFHQADDDLWQPFFLARVFEAVLAEGPLRRGEQELVAGVLTRLNDYVGHRPVAVLETRPRGEPYDLERVRPIPLYLQGAGVAAGRYHDLVARALDILAAADPALREEAGFDPALLEELALDPRAYDHGHPANKRPNYVFGEWDPHHIDNRGRYRRFVVRQLTLDAVLDRARGAGGLPPGEALFEAAAVLAGVILMAAGVSGAGPDTHDSSTSLATLIPRIARYRDRFYAGLLATVGGAHGQRLRREAQTAHQSFGGARQHLNQYLARHRALQLQQRHLALLLASMGYPEASRKQAARIPAASVRLLSEIHLRLTTGWLRADAGDLGGAAALLPEVEDLLRRGIACGALPDPWNVLGFQGLYPLFTAMEDSVRDTRIDELVAAVEQTFLLYARLMTEAAATGAAGLGERLAADLTRLAAWWDRFATYEVGDVRRVRGAEVVSSGRHVAAAMTRWRERGQAAADLAFWQQHLEGFRSPKAFALVVEALLDKEDYRAAMGLLVSWLGQAEQVPLEDGPHSFYALGLRWMLGVCRLAARPPGPGGTPPFRPWELAVKFLDHLEANAEEFWQVPRLDVAGTGEEEEEEEEVEDLYGAAYEGVTYEDSTADDVEGEVLEVGPRRDYDLEEEGQRLEKRLHFLAALARLWSSAARLTRAPGGPDPAAEATLTQWLARARHNYQGLLALLDAVHDHPVPEPTGATESLVEYNRRRELKEHLLHVIIAACLDTALCVGALQGRLQGLRAGGGGAPAEPPAPGRPAWEPPLIALEEALWDGDVAAARRLVADFLGRFRHEPLLFVPLSMGGHPRPMLRAAIAQTILRALAANLPRVGLLRETLEAVRAAQEMEQAQPPEGFRVTEFGRLFQAALQAAVEAVVDSSAAAGAGGEADVLPLLEQLVHPFMELWNRHSQTFLVATLETVRAEADWEALRAFIRRYGRDLFHVRFLAPGNLRGILQRGVGAYLDDLQEHPDPLHPVLLADDLSGAISREDAERHLQVILQCLLENYEEYKDYSATAPQSDYGDNLHILLDFFRLKAAYERYAWQLRPLALVHEVLARRQPDAAALWQMRFAQLAGPEAERLMRRLEALEAAHGIRLRTVADRVRERFIKPLALDRLCALIPPAMAAAGGPGAAEALGRLERELSPHLEDPSGVGLDVPPWLQRLEATVQQTRAAQTALAELAEELFRIPKVVLPPDALRAQLGGGES